MRHDDAGFGYQRAWSSSGQEGGGRRRRREITPCVTPGSDRPDGPRRSGAAQLGKRTPRADARTFGYHPMVCHPIGSQPKEEGEEDEDDDDDEDEKTDGT